MLFDLKSFDQFALSFAGVTLHNQWDARVAKVGGKVFMILGFKGLWAEQLIFKTTDMSFSLMMEQNGIICAPYFNKGHWVAVSKVAGLKDEELKLYLQQSYKLICAKLTKKLRGELGIDLNPS